MTRGNRVAVIGEAVADAFAPAAQAGPGALDLRVRPGGGPANTAVALARLGVPTTFLGRIPHGLLGTLLRDHLAGSGVDLGGLVDAPEEPTLAITTVDAAGQARYSFYAEGTADWQWTAAELEARHPYDATCIHTGSIALVREPGGPLIEDVLVEHRGRATISIDPNVRPGLVPVEHYRRRLARWTSVADIVRLSEEDLAVLRPGASIEEICDEWHAQGVRLIVVTQGEKGSTGSYDGVRITVPAVRVVPVDTVGAGDSFTAGLLFWLHQNGHLANGLNGLTADHLAQALALASYVAAETCRKAGADPPWLEDLRFPISG